MPYYWKVMPLMQTGQGLAPKPMLDELGMTSPAIPHHEGYDSEIAALRAALKQVKNILEVGGRQCTDAWALRFSVCTDADEELCSLIFPRGALFCPRCGVVCPGDPQYGDAGLVPDNVGEKTNFFAFDRGGRNLVAVRGEAVSSLRCAACQEKIPVKQATTGMDMLGAADGIRFIGLRKCIYKRGI